MLSIHYDKSIDTLKHLVEVPLKQIDVLNDATHLNDLFVTQEVESGELFTLVLDIFLEAFHEGIQASDHTIDSLFEVLLGPELLVGHPLCCGQLAHGAAVLSVNPHELSVLVFHLRREV